MYMPCRIVALEYDLQVLRQIDVHGHMV
jgi:hypothetical protein